MLDEPLDAGRICSEGVFIAPHLFNPGRRGRPFCRTRARAVLQENRKNNNHKGYENDESKTVPSKASSMGGKNGMELFLLVGQLIVPRIHGRTSRKGDTFGVRHLEDQILAASL